MHAPLIPSAAYDVVEDGNACSALSEPVQDNHLALDDGDSLRVAMMLVLCRFGNHCSA